MSIKISIITVCYNAEKTINKTIESVLNQDYLNIEYILIDGQSKDKTMEIVNQYKNNIDIIVSEPDMGMYDAINKGIKLATGDILGIINADDQFADTNIVSSIVSTFKLNTQLEAIIADIVFVDNNDIIIRRYSSKNWNPEKFIWGFMPPHPSFYCKRELFYKLGFYRTDFEIAADFELLIRFIKLYNLNYTYIPLVIVKMKLGGKSTKGISSTIKINSEIKLACEINNLKTNYFLLYLKYFFKLKEFIKLK